MVAQRLANTAQPPHPQSETGTFATHSGKKREEYIDTMKIYEGRYYTPQILDIIRYKCIFSHSKLYKALQAERQN